MEKQLQDVCEIQLLLYKLEDLNDEIHLKLENAIDEAISFYENEIANINLDCTDYGQELYRFNYENLERRHKHAG